MTKLILSAFLLSPLAVATAPAQERQSPSDVMEYSVSAQCSATGGDNTPLWLNANKYGLSSLNNGNGYIRASITKPVGMDAAKKWSVGYCADIVEAFNYTSSVTVQQAYIETRWLKGRLTVGSKEYPMELKNQSLSSGSQTLGINARPVPQVRIALPEYWTIPFTKGWVGMKGHIAYGMTTDGRWQEGFAAAQSKYTSNTLFHSKAGYLKIGNTRQQAHVSLELGLEMAAQFGGTSYNVNAEGGLYAEIKNGSGLKDFWNAFIPGGYDPPEGKYQNVSGNQMGSWVARLNFDYDKWYLGLYADHFFEDHSAMFFLDYDGYGEGKDWAKKEKSRYLLYDLKDMMLGVELKLKRNPWLNNIVFEYLYSKYQSGPIYHDHNENISDHIGGVDDYYNHSIFSGWQHWGQVMGNPLYLSPIYNDDGKLEVKNNRLYAFHLGMSGCPSDRLRYRVMASYQKGFGRYYQPYSNPRENLSVMAETEYSFRDGSALGGWSVTAACGMDIGKLMGDNYGLQITIVKKGVLNYKSKKK